MQVFHKSVNVNGDLHGNIVVYLFFDTFSCFFPSTHGWNSPFGIAYVYVYIINILKKSSTIWKYENNNQGYLKYEICDNPSKL